MNELRFRKNDKARAAAWLDSLIDSLDGEKEYLLSVKRLHGKRSLSANAYFWVLCDKLSEHLRMSKEDIYRNYIRNIGGNAEYMRIQNNAVNTLKRAWESHGIGWQVETIESGYEGWVDVILYYGSSTFNSETMSRLIRLAVQDCDSFGIETLDSAEIERICLEWEKCRRNDDG